MNAHEQSTAVPESNSGEPIINGRSSRGQFLPGHSGNPGGRPKMPTALREAMRGLADEALTVLEDALKSDDERVRLMAVAQIFDRGYGKPTQTVDMNTRFNPA